MVSVDHLHTMRMRKTAIIGLPSG